MRFVKLELKVVKQKDRELVDVILLYMSHLSLIVRLCSTRVTVACIAVQSCHRVHGNGDP